MHFNEVQKHKHNPSSLWKTIIRYIPGREKESQVYTRGQKVVADEFNQYFTSLGRNAAEEVRRIAEDNNIDLISPLSTAILYSTSELFNFKPVTCTEVQRIILSMPSNKSPGLDKTSLRVIQDSLPVILGPLTDIINRSLTSSTFPDAWKSAQLIPLLKEGDHQLASQNRPLSLLVVASKTCERVVLTNLAPT